MEVVVDEIGRDGPTARLERRAGKLVAVSTTVVTDEDVLGLVETIRLPPA